MLILLGISHHGIAVVFWFVLSSINSFKFTRFSFLLFLLFCSCRYISLLSFCNRVATPMDVNCLQNLLLSEAATWGRDSWSKSGSQAARQPRLVWWLSEAGRQAGRRRPGEEPFPTTFPFLSSPLSFTLVLSHSLLVEGEASLTSTTPVPPGQLFHNGCVNRKEYAVPPDRLFSPLTRHQLCSWTQHEWRRDYVIDSHVTLYRGTFWSVSRCEVTASVRGCHHY